MARPTRFCLALLTLIGLIAGSLSTPALAQSAERSTPVPAEGYYRWYDFDCASGPCGGAYGDWEVDFQVASGGKAIFSHVGATCHGDYHVYFNFTKTNGTRRIHRNRVAIRKSFRVSGRKYTVQTKLSWITEKKAKGWVKASGRNCTAPKRSFTIKVD